MRHGIYVLEGLLVVMINIVTTALRSVLQQCPETSSNTKKKKKATTVKSKSDGNLMANLKTAAMLFVVTVVFVITYLPAFLMVLHLVPYNMIVFYLYFANNVANPVIYSFMNQVTPFNNGDGFPTCIALDIA